MAETRETQVIEDVINGDEISNPRTTEEAILAQVVAGEEVTINARNRLQYWLSQLRSGSSVRLMAGNYNVEFNGREVIHLEPLSEYDGFSDFTISVSWQVIPYKRITFSSSNMAGMTDWFDSFSEALPAVGGFLYGSISMNVVNQLAVFPIEVTNRGSNSYELLGGAIYGTTGGVFSFSITEESCTCNTLYQISDGSITDLTSMAGSVLSNFAGGIYKAYD